MLQHVLAGAIVLFLAQTCFGCTENCQYSDCLPGTFFSIDINGQGVCLPCPTNTYSTGPSLSCAACPAGKYAPYPGSTTCTASACGLGQSFNIATGLCSSCGPGYYRTFPTTVWANSGCQQCDPGYIPDTVDTYAISCRICPVGTYATTAGLSACTPCAVGTYSDVPGATECSPCASAWYPGAADCYTCTGTTYYDPVSEDCVACPAESISAALGACVLCPPGKFASIGTGICLDCATNTYQSDYGPFTSCTACPFGQTAMGMAAITCTPCQMLAQLYLITTCPMTLEGCPGGFIPPEIGMCEECDVNAGEICPSGLCPAGQRVASGLLCNACPPGTYAVQSQTVCLPCPAGTYNPLNGASECLFCPGATTAGLMTCPVGGLSGVNGTCLAGQYLDIITDTCFSCPVGTYTSSGYSTECIDCEPGYNTVGGMGSTTCLSCQRIVAEGLDDSCPSSGGACTPGFYFDPTQGKCLPCAAGFYKTNSSGSCVACPPNTYAPLAGSGSCQFCPNADGYGFIECPLTTTVTTTITTTTVTTATITCTPGFQSTAAASCVACPAGTFSTVGVPSCTLCPAGTYSDHPQSTTCKPCVFAASPGSIACEVVCEPGMFHLNGACIYCYPGTYQPVGGNTSTCLPCPQFAFSSVNGASACVNCTTAITPGYNFCPAEIYTAPQSCPPGYVFDGVCTPCQPGTYSNFNTTCLPCPVNSFTPEYASTSCSPCPALNATGSTECRVFCPAGSYVNGAVCTKCPAGQYYPDISNTESCRLCSVGTYVGVSGATACLRCPTSLGLGFNACPSFPTADIPDAYSVYSNESTIIIQSGDLNEDAILTESVLPVAVILAALVLFLCIYNICKSSAPGNTVELKSIGIEQSMPLRASIYDNDEEGAYSK